MEKGEVEIRKQNISCIFCILQLCKSSRLSVKAKQARVDRIHRTRGTVYKFQTSTNFL